MEFPKTLIGRVAWLSSAAAAVTACVLLVITLKDAAPVMFGWRSLESAGGSASRQRSSEGYTSATSATGLVEAVQAANSQASLELDRRVGLWKTHLASLVDRERMGAFVEKVTSYSQKFHQGVSLVAGDSGEERLWKSFREIVVDERQLMADVQATLEGYEAFLVKQDHEILRAAGMGETAAPLVKVTISMIPDCRQLIQPIITLAKQQARTDIGRESASWIIGAIAERIANEVAREVGLNDLEPGSRGDGITRIGIGLAAGKAVDDITDPTERLIRRFTDEVSRAGHNLLSGGNGLTDHLHRLKAEHERARARLLSVGAER